MIFLKKIKESSPASKAAIAFFISTLITKGIAYLTTPIYTRLLTTEEYGQVSVYLTWMQVFGIVAMFCLSYGVFNNGMVDYPDKRDDYSFSMLILSNIITISFFGVVLALYPLISSFLDMDIPLLILMLVIFLVQPAYNFWCVRQRYEYKYKMVLVWSIAGAILSPLVAVVLLLTNKTGSNIYPRIFGAECVLIIIYLGFYIFLGFKNRWKIHPKYWKEALLFNLPLIPHYLSMYLLGSSDRIMISHLVGRSQAAFYSVASSVATVAIIMWTAENSSLIPFSYEKCREHDYSAINKVALPLLGVFALGCVSIIMFAPEVVWLMSTSEYMEAIYVIPPIVGGVFFQAQYYLYANILYYYKKPLYVMFGSLTAVSLNIVLNYFCIKHWGYLAAGYTTIVCYGIQALIDAIAMRFAVKEKVYNFKIIILLSLTVVSISIISVLFYNLRIVRYCIFALILILIIIFIKKIIRVFNFSKKPDDVNSCEDTGNS